MMNYVWTHQFTMLQKSKQGKLRICIQSGILEYHSSETREVAYTYRYTSGHLFPNSVYTHEGLNTQ